MSALLPAWMVQKIPFSFFSLFFGDRRGRGNSGRCFWVPREAQGADRHPSMCPQPYSSVPACPWPSPHPHVAISLSPWCTCGCHPLPAVPAHRWMSPVPVALLVPGHRPPHGHGTHVATILSPCTCSRMSPCPRGHYAQKNMHVTVSPKVPTHGHHPVPIDATSSWGPPHTSTSPRPPRALRTLLPCPGWPRR